MSDHVPPNFDPVADSIRRPDCPVATCDGRVLRDQRGSGRVELTCDTCNWLHVAQRDDTPSTPQREEALASSSSRCARRALPFCRAARDTSWAPAWPTISGPSNSPGAAA